MSNSKKIIIRTGYMEHLGYYAISAYLPAKSTVVQSPGGKKQPGMSWQIIHRSFDRAPHENKIRELINSGEYEQE